MRAERHLAARILPTAVAVALTAALAACGSQAHPPAPAAPPGAGLQEGSLPVGMTGAKPIPRKARGNAGSRDAGQQGGGGAPASLQNAMSSVGRLDGVGAAAGAAAGGPVLTAGAIRTEAAWSTIKVPLLIAYLNWIRSRAGTDSGREALTGAERDRITSLITVSSNDVANELFDAMARSSGGPQGAGALVQETLAAAGDEQTRVAVAPPDGARTFTWLGQTQWAPASSVKFLRALAGHSLASAADTEWVLGLMGRIEGSDWGFHTALAGSPTPLRYKVGVGTSPDGQTVVRQIAIIGAPGQACVADVVARGTGEALAKDRAGAAARLIVDGMRSGPGGAITCGGQAAGD